MNDNQAQKALVWFANMMMQIPEYQPNWTPDFCVKQAIEYRDTLKKHLTESVDFKTMSVDELKSLGFSWWNETENLLLCPLWLANTLFPDVDHDHRFGKIAYGFTVE